jgi:parvulin-like peptidyl-prolyl isomerase
MDYYIRTLQFYGKARLSSDLADEVVTLIQRNELIKQGAAKLGLSISQDMIDEELRNRDLPVRRYSRDIVNSEMLTNTLQDEYFEKELPVFVEQRHIRAMLLESESQVVEVRARVEAGEDFINLARELSLEITSENEDGDFGWQPESALTVLLGTPVVDEYAFNSEVGILSEPVQDEEVTKNMGYFIVKVLDREEELAEVRGILLGSEEEARWARDRLMNGTDFDELAKALSKHEISRERDGYLGLWTPDEINPALSEFVFNTEIELETVSEPIFDDTIAAEGGYWLIEVLERKERANVLGILLGSKEEAQWIKGKLDAGESFGELAEEFSQHTFSKEPGGSLGWLKRGRNLAFTEFLFDSDLNTVSEPIRYDELSTKGGYWLIEVVGKDDTRQLDDSHKYLLKVKALEDWIESLWNDPENKIESYLDNNKKSWAIEYVNRHSN